LLSSTPQNIVSAHPRGHHHYRILYFLAYKYIAAVDDTTIANHQFHRFAFRNRAFQLKLKL
jgi:hypothetical protein